MREVLGSATQGKGSDVLMICQSIRQSEPKGQFRGK